MKRAFTLALTLAAGMAAADSGTDPIGYTAFTTHAPHHGRTMSMAIWYPAAGDGKEMMVADSAVFQGFEVRERATAKQGSYPIVLLSHGMGGNTRSLAWLAAGLVEQGAVVVNVNHPNSTWGDFDLAEGLRHWTRVQDLSLALDTLLADARFADHLDTSRIMASGFSFGGWTALSMGGMRGNHAGYVAHCEEYESASAHCRDLLREDLGLTEVDESAWNASYADPRVTHVVAIDPGLVWGMSKDDAGGLVDPVRMIGFGAGEDRMLAVDFDKSGLAALMPEAQIDNIVPATHFTAMPVCTPMGAAILAEEKDDPVCTDPAGTDRAGVHDMIIEMIVSDLNS